MPLRVWRSDEVKELTAHQNDPAPSAWPSPALASGKTATEFLVTFTPAVPDGTPAQDLAQATAAEAEMQAILGSLPQIKYLTTQTTELTPHPSDPAAPGSRSMILERIEAERG